MQTTIDRAGRVVIPKPLRERAGLQPGLELNVEYSDGKIEIEPARKDLKLVRKGSLLVAIAPAGTPPLTNQTIREILGETRAERSRKALGRPR